MSDPSADSTGSDRTTITDTLLPSDSVSTTTAAGSLPPKISPHSSTRVRVRNRSRRLPSLAVMTSVVSDTSAIVSSY